MICKRKNNIANQVLAKTIKHFILYSPDYPVLLSPHRRCTGMSMKTAVIVCFNIKVANQIIYSQIYKNIYILGWKLKKKINLWVTKGLFAHSGDQLRGIKNFSFKEKKT